MTVRVRLDAVAHMLYKSLPLNVQVLQLRRRDDRGQHPEQSGQVVIPNGAAPEGVQPAIGMLDHVMLPDPWQLSKTIKVWNMCGIGSFPIP